MLRYKTFISTLQKHAVRSSSVTVRGCTFVQELYLHVPNWSRPEAGTKLK